MTDPRPICPIPPDARVGDIVVNTWNERCSIKSIDWSEDLPYEAGDFYYSKEGVAEPSTCHLVSFEYADGRKPNLPHTGKPKRTQAQRDSAFIRSRVDSWWHRAMTTAEHERMVKIADRMEGKT